MAGHLSDAVEAERIFTTPMGEVVAPPRVYRGERAVGE